MTSLTRRTVYYLLVLIVATLALTGAYSLGMSVWEQRPRPWYQSFQVVVRLSASSLEGQPLKAVDPESQTNYTVLTVSRGDSFLIDPDEEGFIFEADDKAIVAGTDGGLQQFRERFRGSGFREE